MNEFYQLYLNIPLIEFLISKFHNIRITYFYYLSRGDNHRQINETHYLNFSKIFGIIIECDSQKQNSIENFVSILLREITLGDIPKVLFFQNYLKSSGIKNYGFCFRKSRWVTFPGFCLWLTFSLNIFSWWRHSRDKILYTYTLTGDLSVTYVVSDHISLVSNKILLILFRKSPVALFPKCRQ